MMIRLGQIAQRTREWLNRFAGHEGANIAVIFVLSLIPLIGAVGGGIDVSRTIVMKTRLASALDAAALAVGTTNSLPQDQLQTLAQKYFDANFPPTSLGTTQPVKVSVSGQTVSLSVDSQVPTTLLKLLHVDKFDLTVSNQVVRTVTKLRVALVLDNTGSMAETDNSGTSKISALKTATHQLLVQLQKAAVSPGDVQVGIIPFAKDVNADSSNYNAGWIDWTDWETKNRHNVTTTTSSPWTCTGRGCSCNAINNCSCSGRGAAKTCTGTLVTTTTSSVPDNHNTWTGCIMDRDKNYDTQNTTPGANGTLFPAEQYNSCPTSVQALSYNWAGLDTKVDAMAPKGGTNQTIGLAWGWQALTQGNPLNAPAPDPEAQNVIVLLSDGLNTQNRWDGNGTQHVTAVDDRMALACANAKAANVMIYTVLVMAGNSSVLRSCATDSEKYFELTTAGEIVTAFQTIATELANLHLSR